jgi:ABC-type antimicrobial peptide transport system permease subunit
VDDRELIRGEWTIVGVVDGSVKVGLVPLNMLQTVLYYGSRPQASDTTSSYLLFPKRGQMPTLDAFILDLPRREVTRYTYEGQKAILQTEYDSAMIVIWVIDVVTVTVLSLATGLLNTIYFLQRMHEYGTLAAIGYRVSFLIRRTLAEAMALTLISWGVGLLMAQVFTIGLRAFIFEPRGFGLTSLNAQALYFTTPIPILIAIFSLFTVIRQFHRIDPVTIVEGRG